MLMEIVDCDVEVDNDICLGLCPEDKDMDTLRKGKDFILPYDPDQHKDLYVYYEVCFRKPKHNRPRRTLHHNKVWIEVGYYPKMDVALAMIKSDMVKLPYPGNIVQADMPIRAAQQTHIRLQQEFFKNSRKTRTE